MKKIIKSLSEYIRYKIQRYKFKRYQKKINKKAEKYKIIKEIIRETLLKDEQMYKGVVEFMKGVEWKEDNQNQNKHKIKSN